MSAVLLTGWFGLVGCGGSVEEGSEVVNPSEELSSTSQEMLTCPTNYYRRMITWGETLFVTSQGECNSGYILYYGNHVCVAQAYVTYSACGYIWVPAISDYGRGYVKAQAIQ